MGFLNEHYIHWLQQHTELATDKNSKRLRAELIYILPHQFRLKDLILVLSDREPRHHRESNALLSEACELYKQLKKWNEELLFIKHYVEASLHHINSALRQCYNPDLVFPPEVVCLIHLIRKIVDNSCAHSHLQIVNFFQILNDPQLPQIMSYLSRLEDVSQSPLVGKGFFRASSPIDDDHAAALKLLNNVAQDKSRSPYAHKANALLQSSLLIYQDFHFQSQYLLDQLLTTVIHEPIVGREEKCWDSICALV